MTSPFLAFTPTADGTLNRQGLIYAILRMVLFTVTNLAGLGQTGELVLSRTVELTNWGRSDG